VEGLPMWHRTYKGPKGTGEQISYGAGKMVDTIEKQLDCRCDSPRWEGGLKTDEDKKRKKKKKKKKNSKANIETRTRVFPLGKGGGEGWKGGGEANRIRKRTKAGGIDDLEGKRRAVAQRGRSRRREEFSVKEGKEQGWGGGGCFPSRHRKLTALASKLSSQDRKAITQQRGRGLSGRKVK